MKNEIMRLNTTALAAFNKTMSLANQVQAEQEQRAAEWFDTPEKRIRWWLDLEPQWCQAFNQAVLMHEYDADIYNPTDEEIQFLFNLKHLEVCGNGFFENRNNRKDISFQLTNLSGVTHLTRLVRIDCDYNGLIESLEPLRHLTNLQTLWCDNNLISDLSPLMGLENLRSLCCWNNQIKNIEPLASLPSLSDVTLGLYDKGNPIEDPTPLGLLPNLRYVYLSSCNITSLEFLSNCKHLRYVEASYNPISDPDFALEGVKIELIF